MSKLRPIYMDYASTTPIDPIVQEAMIDCIKNTYGNPASRSHTYGWEADALVDTARKQVAQLLGADTKSIVFTSGATESINLALKGAAQFYASRGKHIVTCKTEHKAVLDVCRQLETEGFEVTYCDPLPNGLIDMDVLKAALREDTTLVSIMHVNNEIGVIQDIEAIGTLTREKGILLHIDAAQSAGKITIDVEKMKVDLMSISGHKLYGPKGIGALYVRRKPRVRLKAQTHGGGHERGMRSGTLATHQIVGLGTACQVAMDNMAQDTTRILALRNKLWDGLKDMEAVVLNGDLAQRVPGNLNVSLNYVEGESLLMALKNIALSSGSACTSASLEPSYVLRALGLSDELAHSSLRFGIGRFTTDEDIEAVIKSVRAAVTKLRDLSPLWEMYKAGIDLDTVQWTEH